MITDLLQQSYLNFFFYLFLGFSFLACSTGKLISAASMDNVGEFCLWRNIFTFSQHKKEECFVGVSDYTAWSKSLTICLRSNIFQIKFFLKIKSLKKKKKKKKKIRWLTSASNTWISSAYTFAVRLIWFLGLCNETYLIFRPLQWDLSDFLGLCSETYLIFRPLQWDLSDFCNETYLIFRPLQWDLSDF